MWQIIVLLLTVALTVVLVRYQLLKKSMAEMASSMVKLHDTKTNRQLTIGMQQPQFAQLANEINALYESLDTEKMVHSTAMAEMRQNMADISHDLRTPLTSILGYLKLMRSGKNTREQQQRYLEVAYRKAGSLNLLVNSLFELARLESGSYIFEHEQLDAVALLQEELASIYTLFSEKGLVPVIELPKSPLWIIGDRQAMARVFSNLLQNMVKHGKPPISVSAKIQAKQVVFCFSNAAPNLNDADVPQLFKRFYTADHMRTGKDTGLGLAIVKEFSLQMRGSVDATMQDNILAITVSWPLVAGVD